jgi:ADP-ribosylglycohydrolase
VDDAAWLLGHEALHAQRAPGATCLQALRAGVQGSTITRPNTSKGCGGVMRIAPAGLMGGDGFELGCELAALTHGHPSGYLSAGVFALIIASLYSGDSLRVAVDAALERVALEPDCDEVLHALEGALGAAYERPPIPETVEGLGGGWVAEEALAIAVFAALVAGDFSKGVLLAANHSGDSDSTGAMAGNLLGVMLGEEALPQACATTLNWQMSSGNWPTTWGGYWTPRTGPLGIRRGR